MFLCIVNSLLEFIWCLAKVENMDDSSTRPREYRGKISPFCIFENIM